jgi:hypothetical protein
MFLSYTYVSQKIQNNPWYQTSGNSGQTRHFFRYTDTAVGTSGPYNDKYTVPFLNLKKNKGSGKYDAECNHLEIRVLNVDCSLTLQVQ